MRSDLKERKERIALSFQWWAKESHRGTPVVVKMENPNWSMVELEGPTEDDFLIKTDSLGSYQRQRPPRTQKRQAAHLGPNAQSPPCRWLLDLHHLRNVRPRRLDPPPSRFGLNRLRRNRKRERARE